MSTTTNSGRDFAIQNVTISASSPTPVTIPTSLIKENRVSSILVQCRTAVALQLTRNQGDGNYFTIPASSGFSLDISPGGTSPTPIFYLLSTSGTVVAEIMFATE